MVGGTLRQMRRLTEQQTRFVQAHAPGPVKMTLPSPSQFPAISFQPGITEQFYPTRSALLWALVPIIKGEIAALIQDGVSYIQVDAPLQLLCGCQMAPASAGLRRGPRRLP